MNAVNAWLASTGNESAPYFAWLGISATAVLCLAWVVTAVLRRASGAVRHSVWQSALAGLLVLPVLLALLPGVPLGISLVTPPDKTIGSNEPPTMEALRPSNSAALHRLEYHPPIEMRSAPPPSETGGGRNLAMLETPGTDKTAVARSAPALGEDTDSEGTTDPRKPSLTSNTEKTLQTSTKPGVSPKNRSWSSLFFAVWAIGVVVNLAWLVRCLLIVKRILRGAQPLHDARFLQPLGQLAGPMSIRKPVQLLKSSKTSVPLVLGVFRPRILLPADCESWSTERIRIVLMHELVHVERRDILSQLFARTVAALYWFHPLVWLAVRRMRQERERACDDRVILAGVQPEDYAAGLVEVAAAIGGRQIRLLGGTAMADRGQLEHRLRSILDRTLPRGPASTVVRRGLLLATALCVIALGALRPFSPIAGETAEKEPVVSKPAVDPSKSPQSPPETSKPETAKPKPTARLGNPLQKLLSAIKPKPKPRSIRGVTSGAVQIHVVDTDGNPVPGARIHVSVWTKEPFKNNRDYVCDANGQALADLPKTFRIVRIWARKDRYAPLWAQWWPEKQTDADEIPEQFTFRLEKGTVMGGVIKNEAGEPIEGVKVEVVYEDGGLAKELSQRTSFDRWLAEGDDAVTTDKQGRWILDNVPPGDGVRIGLKLSHPEYIAHQYWGAVQQEQHVSVKSLRDQSASIVMRRGISLTGKVTDPDGNPVAGAVVVRGDSAYFKPGSQEVRTDEDGVYRLPPLSAGDLNVTVVAKDWMPVLKKIEISPDMQPVDFKLQPGKKLRIQFVDKAGQPVPGVHVRIEGWRGIRSLYNDRHSSVLNTHIPTRADKQGVFEWTWAPDDPVQYGFSKEGFAHTEVSLTADDSEQTQSLHAVLLIAGQVTDGSTGQPIDRFRAVPVEEFSPRLHHVDREGTKLGTAGRYALELERTDVAHRVRIEADGYRTAMSDVYYVGDPDPVCNFVLEPSLPVSGRVIDLKGNPAAETKVFLATKTQSLKIQGGEDNSVYDNYRAVTDEQGEFQFPAQFEPYTIVVLDDNGYAEVALQPDETPGDIPLQAWAKIEGRLFQAGSPVPNTRVRLDPLRPRVGAMPYISDDLWTRTDENGRYSFAKVPPVRSALSAHLHVWDDFPITSGQHVPLDIQPGQQLEIDLNGDGAQVSGRVALTGEMTDDFDLHYSLNYLLRLAPGIEPAEQVQAADFDWKDGWSDAWVATPEGRAYVETLHYYFVKLNRDGTFLISGVPAGEYELSFRLYEPPVSGCLVNPIGTKTVRFRVTDDDVRRKSVDLDKVEIEPRLGPHPGEPVPDFEFTTLDGDRHKLSDFRGRYVLIDFWATWCGPCVQSLPAMQSLYKKHGGSGQLVILGMSVDADVDKARTFVRERELPWMQGFAGDISESPIVRQCGISIVPTYLLVAPDGKLIDKSFQFSLAAEKIASVLGAVE